MLTIDKIDLETVLSTNIGSIPTKGHEATEGSGVISDAQEGLSADAEFQSRD